MKTLQEKGLYKTAVNDGEVQGLRKWNWPTRVSSEILPENLLGKTVIDVGAGPSHSLGDLIVERDGRYIAIDVNEGLVEIQRKLGREVYQADICNVSKVIPPTIERTHVISHTRLVFMHLSPEKMPQAVHELATVGSMGYVLDTNWKNFIQSASGPRLRDFIDITLDFAQQNGIDLYHGGKLKQLLIDTLGDAYEINECIFSEGIANHYDELINLAQRQMGFFNQNKNDTEIERLKTIIKSFEKARQKNDPKEFFESPHTFHVVSFAEKRT